MTIIHGPPLSPELGEQVKAALAEGARTAQQSKREQERAAVVRSHVEAIERHGFTVTSTDRHWARAERREGSDPSNVTKVAAPSLHQLRLYVQERVTKEAARRARRTTPETEIGEDV